MTTADQVALMVAAASLMLALVAAGAMALLILRRGWLERGADRRREQESLAARQMMARLAGRTTATATELPVAARRHALSHLVQLVRGHDRDRLLELAEDERLFEDLIDRLATRSSARRIDSIRLLEQFESKACLEALARCLASDDDLAVRLEAAAALARLGRLPDAPTLVRSLSLATTAVTRFHAAMFRSLAERDGAALLALADDPALVRLRPMLVESLGWSGDLALATTLEGFARNEDPEVRAAAVRAARGLGHPAAASWLIALLDDTSEAVRVQAAQACAQLRLTAAVPALERHVAEPAWWVRTRVREALEILAPRTTPSLRLVGEARR